MKTHSHAGPTLRTELRRGLNPYSLAVSAATALAFALAFILVLFLGPISDVPGRIALVASFAVAGALFGVIAGIHAAMHAYFGWRLGRGTRAFTEGRFQESVDLLRIVERPGIEHYDPSGHARAVLLAARSALRPDPSAR